MEYYNLLYTKELSNIRNDSLKNKENWFILVHFLNHLTAPPHFTHFYSSIHQITLSYLRDEQSIKTCKNRALSEFFVLPLYHQLQLERKNIKEYGK